MVCGGRGCAHTRLGYQRLAHRSGGGVTALVGGRRRTAMQPIYLDYNATTPVDPAVAEAMQPFITNHHGNPSSAHAYGRATKDAVEAARRQVADLLGCAADEVVFTGGGSESNNTVL